jgi:hypothetical protein
MGTGLIACCTRGRDGTSWLTPKLNERSEAQLNNASIADSFFDSHEVIYKVTVWYGSTTIRSILLDPD